MHTNPYMMILKADPERYIQKPAATVLALSKAAEGCLALFALAQFLFSAMGSGFSGTTADLFIGALPFGAQSIAAQAADAMGVTLFAVAGLCCLVFLVCTVLEAVGLLALRFALAGAGLLKEVQRVVFWDCCALAGMGVLALILRIYRFFTTEFRNDILMESLRVVVPVMAGAVIVLVLLSQYQKDVLTVFSAIEYELRLEFKETEIDAPVIGKYSFLFSAVFLVGAVLMVALLHMSMNSPAVITLAALTVKYFMVYQSWEDFRLCHR